MTPHSRICQSCKDGPRWPLGFVHCPTCGAPTKTLIGTKANRTREQAIYAAKERDFNAHYAEREQRRIAEGHVAPEALGKREAQEMIRLERALGD